MRTAKIVRGTLAGLVAFTAANSLATAMCHQFWMRPQDSFGAEPVMTLTNRSWQLRWVLSNGELGPGR